MTPLEIGQKYRIRAKNNGQKSNPIPGLSSGDPLTAFLIGVERGFETRHFLFRTRTGWRISLNEWEVAREYDFKAG
jgi:hypothetical protein